MARQKKQLPVQLAQVAAAEQQIREKQQEVKYDLRDFTVELVVSHFNESLFYIPEYQREHVWNPQRQSRFIESVVLGLPIPMMFLAEMSDGTLEIVDGVQRISTLDAFFAGDLRLDNLERLNLLNGMAFADLPVSQQRKLRTRALRIVVLDETTTFETRQDIFNRVNTSGDKARPAEVRRGAFQGPFMDFIQECAADERFARLCPVSESLIKRREPAELVLRFFAYSDEYTKFKHDVSKFLDQFVVAHQEDFDRERYRQEFDSTLTFVDKHFPHGFAKGPRATSTPRVRFEALGVGVNLALRAQSDLDPRNVDWLKSPEFDQLVRTHASNSGPRLRDRIEFVRDKLLSDAR
jgi:hypothetical protein